MPSAAPRVFGVCRRTFARLVQNHSTYIEGLLPIIKVLSKSKKIITITPGRIYVANKNSGRPLELKLTTSGAARHSDDQKERSSDTEPLPGAVSYKVLARGQSHVQEIFLVSTTEHIDSAESLAEHMSTQLLKEKTKIIWPKSKSKSKLDENANVKCFSKAVFTRLEIGVVP